MPGFSQVLNIAVKITHGVRAERTNELTPRHQGKNDFVGPSNTNTMSSLDFSDKVPDQSGIISSELTDLNGLGDRIVIVFTLCIMKRTYMPGRGLLNARCCHDTRVTGVVDIGILSRDLIRDSNRKTGCCYGNSTMLF